MLLAIDLIERERIVVENANIARAMGMVDINDFKPYAKNPAIAAVFKEIGFADSLGSGIRNLYKYTRMYSGDDPKFEEGDIFKTIIPLKEVATEKVGGNPEIAQEEFKKSLESPSKVPQKSLESPSKKSRDNLMR